MSKINCFNRYLNYVMQPKILVTSSIIGANIGVISDTYDELPIISPIIGGAVGYAVPILLPGLIAISPALLYKNFR